MNAASLFFARTFLKHPFLLGSVIPSSRSLTQRVLRQIDWSGAAVAVEYGPGVGTLTTEMLTRLRPDGVLVAIEKDRELADFLRRSYPDPRLRVVNGSAADVEGVLGSLGLEGADAIVSGIPCSTLPRDVRTAIIESSRRVLRPGGTFVVYQFTGAVLPHLREVFGEVRQEFEPLNILPARVFCCSR